MTALQTRLASRDVLNGQAFFRLFQLAESSGDIFEIDTGLQGLYVGPQSDLADFCLFYYDAQDQPTLVNELVVSVGTPFVGRVDSFNGTMFPTQNQPARLTLSTRDLVDNTYVPRAFVPGTDTVNRFRPALDIIGSLSPVTAAPAPIRANRLVRLFPLATVAGTSWTIVPFYGRRYANIFVTNVGPGDTIVGDILGVKLNTGTLTLGGPATHTEIVLSSGGTLTPPDDFSLQVRATTDGLFDLLAVSVATEFPASSTLLTIEVSDVEGA